ncbi:MAG: Uma2 family endonuclease [Chloroflexaceae bacterium]|nr:Uma2 family endonuclease [Chloroflexaceae bacterium]
MVTQIDTQRTYTPEEYLELETQASDRHEYREGEIIPMAGGTLNHTRIAGNCFLALSLALKGKGYEVLTSDQRLLIPEPDHFTYPDVCVVSGKPQLMENRNDTITNPTLIVEVLSQSTANYDRGDKFLAYRAIATFREYLLIDQSQIYIEQYVKQDAHHWLLTIHSDRSAPITLVSVPARMAIADLYDRVELTDQ